MRRPRMKKGGGRETYADDGLDDCDNGVDHCHETRSDRIDESVELRELLEICDALRFRSRRLVLRKKRRHPF